MFFADLITFIIPATTPTKKKININQGLVPKVLSKINPIIVPTATADTNSVLILNAVPMEDVGFLLLYKFFFDILFFAISKRVLNDCFAFILYATMLSAFCRSTATSWLIPFSGIVIPYSLSIFDIVRA